MTAVIPHLAYPLTISPTQGAAVVEQDALEEVFACVQAIVACPIGAWSEQPTFGIPSLLFAQAPVGAEGIRQAILRWEPRADAAIIEYPDLLSAATRNVLVNVTATQTDH